jgi:stress-induced morphogen
MTYNYPEVPPSAMSNFICNTCGKQFQNQNELIQHQRFEGLLKQKWEDIALTCKKKSSKSVAFISCIIWF